MPNLEKTCCEKCLGRGNPRIGDSYLACVDSDCPCHNPMQNPENPMQEPTKGWEDWGIELGELLDEQGVYTAFTYENGKALRNFISQLLANQKAEIINKIKEKLKHIAMYHERGDEKSVMATYSVKDVLDVLETLKAD